MKFHRAIDEVCSRFSCEVLCDIEEITVVRAYTDLAARLGLEDFGPETHVKPAIAIGSRLEPPLIGFVITPWFHILEELEDFCGKSIDSGNPWTITPLSNKFRRTTRHSHLK
jgi:hypothetical protein